MMKPRRPHRQLQQIETTLVCMYIYIYMCVCGDLFARGRKLSLLWIFGEDFYDPLPLSFAFTNLLHLFSSLFFF